MNKIRGYVRVSTKFQSMERQIRNILKLYPNAKLYQEIFTGIKLTERKQFNRIISESCAGDTIVFDSVSRMSRNAQEGIKIYFDLMNKGINLVFIKEPYINTNVYVNSINQQIKNIGDTIIDTCIDTINKILKIIATKQIEVTFLHSEKEINDLKLKTSEGILTAKLNGKKIGRINGKKIITNKQIIMTKKIKKLLPNHNDKEIIDLIKISRNTYYKYKRNLII